MSAQLIVRRCSLKSAVRCVPAVQDPRGGRWSARTSTTQKPSRGKVPTRRLPDALFRFVAIFLPQLKTLAPLIGQRYELSAVKASRVLGFSPRAADATLYDCALSLGSS